MTLRLLCRLIARWALRGFAKAADLPEPPVLTSPGPAKVLAICPKDHDHLLLRMAAFHDGWELSLARSFVDAISLLRRGAYSIVLYDIDAAVPDWREALRWLVSPSYERIVILISERIDDNLWHQAIAFGAFDVLEKPILGSELLSLVCDARQILETAELRTAGSPKAAR
jgi:DNA-binding NtrC family response regulator